MLERGSSLYSTHKADISRPSIPNPQPTTPTQATLALLMHNLALDATSPSTEARNENPSTSTSTSTVTTISNKPQGRVAADSGHLTEPNFETSQRPYTLNNYKRHASFDSPGEVPLPSTAFDTHKQQQPQFGYPFPTTISAYHSRGGSSEAPSTPLLFTDDTPKSETLDSIQRRQSLTRRPFLEHHFIQRQPSDLDVLREKMQQGAKEIESVHPSGSQRPQSLPATQNGSTDTIEKTIAEGATATWTSSSSSTRLSASSLPLPSHTPYSALPCAMEMSAIVESEQGNNSASSTSAYSHSSSRFRTGQKKDSASISFVAPTTMNFDDFSSNAMATRTTNRTDPLSDVSYSSAMRAGASPRPASLASSEISYPPPEAPVVLSPNVEKGPSQPHERFLPRPVVSDRYWIAVQTFDQEYNLLVSLPGFAREDITLTTKKNRILNIVADSWAPEGGHYERRVSFGYDADLPRVRADFDGDTMKITIPRRPMRASYLSDQESIRSS